MDSPFDISDDVFGDLTEAVTITQTRENRTVASAVRACLIVGNVISTGAGAPVKSDTADRFTVIISSRELERSTAFDPAFGDVIDCGAFGALTVKLVTRGPSEYSLRCTRNVRGTLPR